MRRARGSYTRLLAGEWTHGVAQCSSRTNTCEKIKDTFLNACTASSVPATTTHEPSGAPAPPPGFCKAPLGRRPAPRLASSPSAEIPALAPGAVSRGRRLAGGERRQGATHGLRFRGRHRRALVGLDLRQSGAAGRRGIIIHHVVGRGEVGNPRRRALSTTMTIPILHPTTWCIVIPRRGGGGEGEASGRT